MTASPSSTAQAARERLASRLVDLRKTAGLRAIEVAARCGWHKSKVSRIENGRTLPSDADIRAWCRACGADERGLAHHWDQFTGVVTQLAGRKRWQLWRPVVEHPTGDYLASPDLWSPELQKSLENSPPDAEFELVPGDTLLLPRGWLHNPFSVGVETSLHLTFALKERTWLWLAQQLLGMAIHDTSFRREVPPGAHRSGLASEIGTAAAMAIGFLSRLDPVAAEEWVRGHGS